MSIAIAYEWPAIRRLAPECRTHDLDRDGRCQACGDLVDPRRPSTPSAHEPAPGPCVTREALKRYLKSGASWAEISRSILLGQITLSALHFGAACARGHAKRGPGPCRRCTADRVAAYRRRRARR